MTATKTHRRILATLAAVFGIVVGLLAAEGAFALRDGGAYPYLNIFLRDEVYGVRLMPRAVTRVHTATGHVTEVATDPQGHRCAARGCGATRRADVVLVGDSQAMGFHNSWANSFGARIAKQTGLIVANVSVPTWGPEEYVIAARQAVNRTGASRVLIIVNAANDWSEAGTANRDRTSACDGYACSLPANAGSPFPGRDFLMRRSHLVLAAQRVRSELGDSRPRSRIIDELLHQVRSRRTNRAIKSPISRSLGSFAREDVDVTTVLLPLDVQVAEQEFEKYAVPASDLSSVEVLFDDAARELALFGSRVVDLREPLRSQCRTQRCFLNDDYHLNPRGHEVVGNVLGRVLLEQSERGTL